MLKYLKVNGTVIVGLVLSCVLSLVLVSSSESLSHYHNVTTSEEFRRALSLAENGSVIELGEGLFVGEFELSQNSVVIRGRGDGTIIKLDVGGIDSSHKVGLYIWGDNCEILNLKMISDQNFTIGISLSGSGNTVSGVKLEGFATGLRSFGQESRLSEVSVRNAQEGLIIFRDGNRLANITLQNVSSDGLFLHGNRSRVEHFSCSQCSSGIYVDGDRNRLLHIKTIDSKSGDKFSGVFLGAGRGNVIEDFWSDKDQLTLGEYSSKSMIREGVFGGVYVMGENQTLFEVDVGQLLWISGSGHLIQRVKAKELKNYGTGVELYECEFDNQKGTGIRTEGTSNGIAISLGAFVLVNNYN